MCRAARFVLILLACAWCGQGLWEGRAFAEEPNEPGRVRMSLVGLKASEKGLDLQYEITNGSAQDAWVCADMKQNGKFHFEVILDEDTHTLVVRRRLDFAAGPLPIVTGHGLPYLSPLGSYVRLKPGQQRSESLSLESPIQCRRILSHAQPTGKILYVDRLSLQIGFYRGDLPATIRDILAEAEERWERYQDDSIPLESLPEDYLSDLILCQLNARNRRLDGTTEQVVIPYSSQKLKGERVLEVIVDGLYLPYEETFKSSEYEAGGYASAPPMMGRMQSQRSTSLSGAAGLGAGFRDILSETISTTPPVWQAAWRIGPARAFPSVPTAIAPEGCLSLSWHDMLR
jgi:hypothetical protein